MRPYVFDAYGTLFDLNAAAERYQSAIGAKWQQLSETWRRKHIEYSWHHSLTEVPASFWQLAEQSLDFAIATTGAPVSGEVRAGLLASYRSMPAYPEVSAVLARLKAEGGRLAILSNGDPDMLDEAVSAAGLTGLFEAVLSVASAGIFKPAPAVYRLACQHFGCAAPAISFQSSNRWDIAGAAAFGFYTVWINRSGALNEYLGLSPDRVMSDLSGLLGGDPA
ncbi:MAG TPA: haloacid dehalogenase type II [Hyphomicrobiaceae bacterium]|nr:haloacid dehalogenase type II [Hyphomicrobiaceae bacterium]